MPATVTRFQNLPGSEHFVQEKPGSQTGNDGRQAHHQHRQARSNPNERLKQERIADDQTDDAR